MIPERRPRQGTVWLSCIAHETSRRMGVERQQEDERQMVSIPKRFERLFSDRRVGGGIHQEHAEQHDVTSNTSGFGVVNLQRGDRSRSNSFNILRLTSLECSVRRN
jgi:hypothetical protein